MAAITAPVEQAIVLPVPSVADADDRYAWVRRAPRGLGLALLAVLVPGGFDPANA